jgi:hypothetical protein
MRALLLIAAIVPPLGQSERLPPRIANPGFEQGLRHWTTRGHRGFRAAPMAIVGYSSDRPAEGRGWLKAGWAARSGAPPDAVYHITTLVDARAYRGRRARLSAMTRVPDYAANSGALTIRAAGGAAESRIRASANWRRHAVIFDVPADARVIELGFRLERMSGELEADAVRLERLR